MHATLVNGQPQRLWPAARVRLQHLKDRRPVQWPTLDQIEESHLRLIGVQSRLRLVLTAQLRHRDAHRQPLGQRRTEQVHIGRIVQRSRAAAVIRRRSAPAHIGVLRIAVLNLRPDGHKENGLLIGQRKAVIADVVKRLVVQQLTFHRVVQVNKGVDL